MRWAAAAIGVTVLAVAAIAGWVWFTTNLDATGGEGWSLMATARGTDRFAAPSGQPAELFWMGCSDDPVPYSFIVRLDRDRLPKGPWRVELLSDDFLREAFIAPDARG
jgi:hypothetical protein